LVLRVNIANRSPEVNLDPGACRLPPSRRPHQSTEQSLLARWSLPWPPLLLSLLQLTCGRSD